MNKRRRARASLGALQYRVGSFQNPGAPLAAGASYSQSQAVVVPPALQGNYFITVRTDAYNQVDECGAEDNNLNGGTIVDIQNSLPDLRVTAISAPASATLGTPGIDLHVSVSNDGLNDALTVPIVIILSGAFDYRLSNANYIPSDTPEEDPRSANALYSRSRPGS